jgi:hypothetical protein
MKIKINKKKLLKERQKLLVISVDTRLKIMSEKRARTNEENELIDGIFQRVSEINMLILRWHSQAVRQLTANLLFWGSIPDATSIQ